ncbi:MAG TPA: YezD family protein [Rhizorhapis sp.]
MVNDKIEAAASEKQRHVEESLRSIREALMHLRFGTISLTVHEDQVVQIDVTEKKRLRPS